MVPGMAVGPGRRAVPEQRGANASLLGKGDGVSLSRCRDTPPPAPSPSLGQQRLHERCPQPPLPRWPYFLLTTPQLPCRGGDRPFGDDFRGDLSPPGAVAPALSSAQPGRPAGGKGAGSGLGRTRRPPRDQPDEGHSLFLGGTWTLLPALKGTARAELSPPPSPVVAPSRGAVAFRKASPSPRGRLGTEPGGTAPTAPSLHLSGSRGCPPCPSSPPRLARPVPL